MKSEFVPVVHGELVSENKYAIRLLKNSFANLSSFKKVGGRGFEVFRWKTKKIHNQSSISGWFPWMEYKNKEWSKGRKIPVQVGPPMVTMHKFFKSTAEFRKWIGETNFKHLFNELI